MPTAGKSVDRASTRFGMSQYTGSGQGGKIPEKHAGNTLEKLLFHNIFPSHRLPALSSMLWLNVKWRARRYGDST
jgi:hypothetical protein